MFPLSMQPYHPRLIKTLGWRHSSLDGERANVLPSFLEKRDQVVDGQHDVSDELVLAHANVSNSDTHAEHLLQLELDGRLDLGDLGSEVFGVRDGCWEFASFGETGTEETGDLLDQGVGGDEGVVLARKLLDELLVLVELLQVVGGHGVDTVMLGAINIVLVTKNADGHAWAGDLGQLDGAGETLVTLGVIVLQADLELNSL